MLPSLRGPGWDLSLHSLAKEILPDLLPVLSVILRFPPGVPTSRRGGGALPLDDDLVISGFLGSFDPYRTTFSNLHFC